MSHRAGCWSTCPAMTCSSPMGNAPGREPKRSPLRSRGMNGRGRTARTGRVADEQLMRALHDEHAGPLLRYAMYLTGGDRQRAEDVVQEVLLRAWQHPDAVAGQPARPWLFTVAKNLVIDGQRARRARPQEVGEAALGQRPAPDDVDRALESWGVGGRLFAATAHSP